MQLEMFVNGEVENVTKFEYLGPTSDQRVIDMPLTRKGKVYKCSREAGNDI